MFARKQEVASAIQVDEMVEPEDYGEAMEGMVSYKVKTVQVESSKEVEMESGQEQKFVEADTELPEHMHSSFEEC